MAAIIFQFVLWYLIIGLISYLGLLIAVDISEERLKELDEADRSPIDTAEFLKQKGWIMIFIYPIVFFKLLIRK